MLLKIKVSVEPCLVSVVVLMRGCSGSMRLGRKIKSQYTHYKKIDYTTDIYIYIYILPTKIKSGS